MGKPENEIDPDINDEPVEREVSGLSPIESWVGDSEEVVVSEEDRGEDAAADDDV
jgi:hypothetical protein